MPEFQGSDKDIHIFWEIPGWRGPGGDWKSGAEGEIGGESRDLVPGWGEEPRWSGEADWWGRAQTGAPGGMGL